MPSFQRIAIIGGGPAGALAAAQLADGGRQVLLFDEKLAWEKPCGGGLTDKALAQWPFLRNLPVERNWVSDCELIAPSGRRVQFVLDRQIAIFSRLALNGLLLDRARDAGATLLRRRVLQIDESGSGWTIRTVTGSYAADFVVLAAGARNSLRTRFAAALGPENFMVAVGYYIPGNHHKAQIKFLKDLHGYIWIFPRADHFSAGICGRMQGKGTAELRRTLEASLPQFGLILDGASFYAHIIPSLTPDTLRNSRFAGDGWAMIGDAAGFVDAITGEGLYYALRSAELLSEALLAGEAAQYPALVKKDFLSELEHAARIADRFYGGGWMGGSVIERMIQLTQRSASFREIMRDLFSGAQEYSDLRERVYEKLPRILLEAVAGTLWNTLGRSGANRQGRLGSLEA
ncbi:MAG TPA: NAD(P)/FAD-dependent oxidoreductase [Terriglobales bacterium]|nr:NAD(P)/FAD-dependent oxidoreductase [Terriglobales bacterium]